MPRSRNLDWVGYLERHHRQSPGITDDLLSRAITGHHTPYQWLARAISPRAQVVLDVACGSGPMARALERPNRRVIGVDINRGELKVGRERSQAEFVCADSLALPLRDESVDAVVSALGLAMIHPTSALVGEIARVLKPGGVLAFIAPALLPLSPSDMVVAAGVAQRLRTLPRFPGPLEFTSFKPILAGQGLRKVEDAHERYRVTLRSKADAERLVTSLFLPITQHKRRAAAIGYLERKVLRHGEVNVPIPMRRFVAIK